jgi:hypothetical protein
MPYPIQQPFDELQALITELGIYQAPALFYLSEIVTPVSIVDSQISIDSVQVPVTLLLPATAGELAAPAANTRLADTGQLPAGDYNVTVLIGSADGNSYRLRRRNAADAADIWSHRFPILGTTSFEFTSRFKLAANERLVVENVLVGVGTYQASIWARV